MWTKIAGYAVLALIAAYGFLVLASEAPDLLALLIAAGVVALDGLLLVLAARRRALGVAIWCGVVALFAAFVQAAWVYIPFAWDVLAQDDSDDVMWFGSALGFALLVSLALMLRRSNRPFGWAVLMGSAQGFATAFLTEGGVPKVPRTWPKRTTQLSAHTLAARDAAEDSRRHEQQGTRDRVADAALAAPGWLRAFPFYRGCGSQPVGG